MPIEIERKFLVTGEFPRNHGIAMVQGYLNGDSEPTTVRVRVEGERAVLTIKGAAVGISRQEFEYEIPLEDAHELIKLVDRPLVKKTRYYDQQGSHTWEVDVFEGENEGLIVAEIELQSEDEVFDKPDWVGKDVSDDLRYANSSLSVCPYSQWAQ